jgi:hypothetical protein
VAADDEVLGSVDSERRSIQGLNSEVRRQDEHSDVTVGNVDGGSSTETEPVRSSDEYAGDNDPDHGEESILNEIRGLGGNPDKPEVAEWIAQHSAREYLTRLKKRVCV